AASEITDGYIRLNVTRGSGLGLDPRAVKSAPNVMVMISTLALYPPQAYEVGLDTITSSFRVIPHDSLDPRVKCIGRYASNILAKQEANVAGAGEAIMLNHNGEVAEATGDNIFIIKDGVVLTPQPTSGLLQGITRDTVMKLLAPEYTVKEVVMTRYDIVSADEAFLTGTAAEVIPMVSIDGRKIGSGTPGPVTKRAMSLYREHTKEGTPFTVAHATPA
ncbi:MAG: aminotransferase class IV, partial [bacterium]